MRTYKHFAPTYVTRKERASRLSREWDIRVDVSDEMTTDKIIKHCKAIDCVYVMVSNVETPDVASYGSKEDHVHIGLVMRQEINRATALALVRGTRKYTDEYAAPRNQRYTYAGWVIHHAKGAPWKTGNDGLLYERGILPMDVPNETTSIAVKSMLDRYGTDATRERFSFLIIPPKSHDDKFLDQLIDLDRFFVKNE